MSYGHTTNTNNRNSVDDYATDPRWVHALIENSEVEFSGLTVVDWAVGSGQLVRSWNEKRPGQALGVQCNFFEQNPVDPHHHVTNPPYRHLNQWIHHALETAQDVAILGPLHSLGGQRRMNAVWNRTPPTEILVISNRMKVNGSPSQFNHVWYVWDANRTPTAKLSWAVAE